MIRLLAILTGILAITGSLRAQNGVDAVISEIEKNNPTLAAFRLSRDAELIGSRIGSTPSDPTAEWGYLWGTPSMIGDRTDIRIVQSFDFPTTYWYKAQLSARRRNRAEEDYGVQRKSILLHASQVCYDLIYCNALKTVLSARLAHARDVALSYRAKFDAGDANILDYNKAQLAHLNASKAFQSIEQEKTALISELTRMNGGAPVEIRDSVFLIPAIDRDAQAYQALANQRNPVLSALRAELEVRRMQESVTSALSFPRLQVGYMREHLLGQTHQGITVGISLPLWEHVATVDYAEASTRALESALSDNSIQVSAAVQLLHAKAITLRTNAEEYRNTLRAHDNSALLRKALDSGEMSLIDYLIELSFHYESVMALLELERDLNKTACELRYTVMTP